jgi:hypothetical protein
MARPGLGTYATYGVMIKLIRSQKLRGGVAESSPNRMVSVPCLQRFHAGYISPWPTRGDGAMT